MKGIRSIIAAGVVGLTLALAGCTSDGVGRMFAQDYGARTDAGYQLPAISLTQLPAQYRRQIVNYETRERPGTIIVDTAAKFLYFVMEDGKAMRYGIGVGREGFAWKGTAQIAMKREWPVWTPPEPMIRRQPELARWRGGMPPGVSNPLGARALYLYRGGSDTGYRLHGTPEVHSIGQAMSSGCIRLINQDIIDLYERARIGAKVIVL